MDGLTGSAVTLRVLKGTPASGTQEVEYAVPMVTGMVVLDAIHYVQHNLDTDLACRWNCKAAKCTFPLVKDLVTDVSRNYEVNREIPPFTHAPDDTGPWRIQQVDIDRLYEYRRCIECFLCQDVCHVLRSHNYADRFYGPRFFVRVAGLEMHPKDVLDRTDQTREEGGLGYCNITKCCTEVCPEHIHITDNAIIPLKERVADRRWDPVRFIGRELLRRPASPAAEATPALPDPAKPPRNRGDWDEAALTNVDITELVKQQIRTRTRPWEK
ncbi:MAG: succinate dehydrogenase/fumarate reductase iron-sulfur subunit [Chloroflexi bacterium]|nr:MAG: succinate dehydrogenase/fumarate reductase iron-sulfur subunit [Chloroflexota bacterium]